MIDSALAGKVNAGLMDDKHKLRIQASMEGQQTIVANIGKKVLVSEMELICLVTFSQVALFQMFSELDGEVGERASRELEELLQRIRETFQTEGKGNGLERLSTSTTAMLGSEKFGKYIC